MRIPVATYRLQFHPEFKFQDALRILTYLEELGISDIYASPIFKARRGSTHGYDVVDPSQLNPELGSDEDFAELTSELSQRGMGWLQDIVPNHMAYDSEKSLPGRHSGTWPLFRIQRLFLMWNGNTPLKTLRAKF